MCGIFACTGGSGSDISKLAFEGLNRLVYRGYDSYGFAGTNGDELHVARSLEPLGDGVSLASAASVLGHTRWATHGAVSLDYCHPRLGESGHFALGHNGVVENYRSLESTCVSDTDAIVQLLEESLHTSVNRAAALHRVMKQLDGQNTVVVLFQDGELLAARNGPPLYLASQGAQTFLASDVLSLGGFAAWVREVADGEVVQISAAGIRVFDIVEQEVEIEWQRLIDSSEAHSKGEHRHYMLKEILEQWGVLPGQLQLDQLYPMLDDLRSSQTVFVAGAGGAGFAASQIARFLRDIAGLKALAIPACEIEDMRYLARRGDFFLAVSQSGETADTIRAARFAIELGCRTGAHTNMPLSTLSKMVGYSIDAGAGSEICVLSTKSAMSQLAFGYLLANACAGHEEMALKNLQHLSRELAAEQKVVRWAQAIAECYRSESHIYVLGQGQLRETAAIAALNIKEASYVHAEAFSAGELKHGVLALIEPGSLVMLYQPDDSALHNVAAEVKARGATLLGIGPRRDERFDEYLPSIPNPDPMLASLCALVPGQLLAYFLAVSKGLNPDRPRNLAKSVTVL